jgi:DNA-binding MarR family transcriptional regulator
MPIRVGESHPSAKLTNQQVISIRDLWNVGHRNIKVMARHFGVSQSNIKKIVENKTWKHIKL